MVKQLLDNKGVSAVLQEVALLLELKGENPFKAKAYANAARTIEILEDTLEGMVREGRLREMKGIGEALSQHIAELVTTGRLQLYEDLKNSIPAGHLEMVKIPGLGPKKIKALYDKLDVKTVGELEYAYLENRLIDLQGFGQESQEKILQGIRSMAHASRKMGFSYIGLSDHSQSARYVGGLTLEKLKKQWQEIDLLNQKTEGLHIFKGIESDVLPDGSLDYEETILRKFDFVIASVHSHFQMSQEEMTQRVIRAIRNPYTTIVAHPTGRLLLAREPYAIDMMRIIEEAADQEWPLNSIPIPIDWTWIGDGASM